MRSRTSATMAVDASYREQLEAQLRALRKKMREQGKILKRADNDLKYHEGRYKALGTSIKILQDQIQVANEGIEKAEEAGYRAAVKYEAALEKSKEIKTLLRLRDRYGGAAENNKEHGEYGFELVVLRRLWKLGRGSARHGESSDSTAW